MRRLQQMHAYDFILVLFSFVYAAAVTHLLSTAGEIIIASRRVRVSWLNAGWMCAALLFTCAWWIGLWDLHTVTVWSVGSVAFYFSVAAGIYLNARLVSPRIPEQGEIDLRAFHAAEGRKYLLAYTVLSVVTVITNAGLGQGGSAIQWPAQNLVIAPMTVATGGAAIFIRKQWVQAVAVTVQILGWFWYFVKLQSALSG
jgi:hypothetical protein